MLTDVTLNNGRGEIARVMAIMSAMDGKRPEAKPIRTGAYEIPHFNFEHMTLTALDGYPELDFITVMRAEDWEEEPSEHTLNCYGVCDSPDAFFASFGEALQKSDRQFVVSFTEIRRDDQPASGGWRWHKWGPYYGVHKPQYEYLHDEKDIEAVYCFHIYELPSVGARAAE